MQDVSHMRCWALMGGGNGLGAFALGRPPLPVANRLQGGLFLLKWFFWLVALFQGKGGSGGAFAAKAMIAHAHLACMRRCSTAEPLHTGAPRHVTCYSYL